MRRPPEDAAEEGVQEASHREGKDGVVAHLHDPEPYPPRRGAEHPLQESREGEEDVEDDGLHGVEADVMAEARVADDAEVESKEGDEGSVRD